MKPSSAALVVAALVLSACSNTPDRTDGITADEARQLNEAAVMLDAESVNVDMPGTMR